MKKILLGTSGLFGAVALFAGAANAQTPTVTVGGYVDFQAGIVSDDNDTNQRSTGFRNDTEITFRIDGKSDSGLGYGGVIALNADVTSDVANDPTDSVDDNATRTYVYLANDWGHLELGSNEGAAESMRLDASNLARATGGINGSWAYFANRPATNGSFIVSPTLPGTHGSTTAKIDRSEDNAIKITYYTPSFSGFQLGVSYTPDSKERGQNTTRSDNDTGSAGNVISAGLSYEGTWDEFSLGLAGTIESGDAEDSTQEDLQAWNIGASLGFAGFNIAGSYGDWGDSLRSKTATNTESDYYTLGTAYDFGPFGASVTYLSSSMGTGTAGVDNDFENLSIGVDYSLAPGLTPYAEVSLYEFDGGTSGAAYDNDGSAVIIGTQLAF